MQPTCSIWPILLLGSRFSTVASVKRMALSRTRLKAGRWAAPVGAMFWGQQWDRDKRLRSAAGGIRQKLGCRRPPRTGWVPGVGHERVGCPRTATIQLGAREPPRSSWVPANRHDPVGAQQAKLAQPNTGLQPTALPGRFCGPDAAKRFPRYARPTGRRAAAEASSLDGSFPR